MSLDLSVNPLRAGLPREKVVDPCIVVIFGGTGDLAKRKLLPALYNLYVGGHLPVRFAITAYASSDWTTEQYREWAREAIGESAGHLPTSGPKWEEFSSFLHYVHRTGDSTESLGSMREQLAELDDRLHTEGNYLFYLAVPPQVFAEYASALGEVGLSRDPEEGGWRRIVVEKPFGTDLESSRELSKALQASFDEDRIFRIDHYLGKETVQNILVFRFANGFVEPLLNADHVDNIQIAVAETLGMEGRGSYYDESGAARDIMQNHMLQVLSLVCMDQPASLDAESIRDAKVDLIRSMSTIRDIGDAVRGRYVEGLIGGRRVLGYREEEHVAPDSMTETYAALRLTIDNARWRGTPVYLRTGKRLAKRVTEVAIELKWPPELMEDAGPDDIKPNVIALRIQPDEGISVRFEAKVPGLASRIRPVKMQFDYGSAFEASVPDAYERLILDALIGDATLYPRADVLEASWQIIDPVIEGWQRENAPLHDYQAGAWGPSAADELIRRDGRSWRRL